MKKTILLGAAGLTLAAAPVLALPAMHADAQPADAVQTLRNGMSADCIDDSDDGLRMMGCASGNTHQQWEVRTWEDGTRQLRNVATGRCLDHSNAYGLRTWTCHDQASDLSRFQSWSKDVTTGSPADGEASGITLKNQQTGAYLAEDPSGWFGIGGGGLVGVEGNGDVEPNEVWS